jgi:hypothetical protein
LGALVDLAMRYGVDEEEEGKMEIREGEEKKDQLYP